MSFNIQIGPFTFTQARFYPDKDWLELENDPGDLAILECETSDGDRWFVPSVSAVDVTGIEIEQVMARTRSGALSVELPTGERAEVLGLEAALNLPR